MAFTKLLAGVYCADHRVAEGKNGVIFGNARALVIDVGTDPQEGSELATFVQQAGFAPSRVVLTHGHSDHVLGGAAFEGAEVFASSLIYDHMRQHLRRFAERKGLHYAELLAQALKPTITFNNELTIDLGGKVVRLFPAPGHSPDGICAYLEQDRLLFASDTVVTGIVPAINDGDSAVLENSLTKIRRMEIEILVPGHGSVLYGSEAIQEWLMWEIAYLSSIRSAVAEVLAEKPSADDEMIALAAPFQRLIGERFPKDKHNMDSRHRATVLKIAAEERVHQGIVAISEGQE
ncbi:MAG: MBL fold metallo-hydrolase [Anaerolineae bacterium]